MPVDCSELAVSLANLTRLAAELPENNSFNDVVAWVQQATREEGLDDLRRDQLIDAILAVDRANYKPRTESKPQRIVNEARTEGRLGEQIDKYRGQLETGNIQPPAPRSRKLEQELEQLYTERDVLRGQVRRRINAMRPKTAGHYVRAPFRFLGSLITTAEASAVGIQGGFNTISHPIEAVRKWIPQAVRMAKSEQSERAAMREMERHPNYPLMLKAKVGFTNTDGPLTQAEESLMARIGNFDIMERGPLGYFSRFHRAYLNTLRFNMFNMLAEATVETRPTLAEAQHIATMVNAATGRAGYGKFEASAQAFAEIAFSPRHYLGRIEMLLGYPLWQDLPTWAARRVFTGDKSPMPGNARLRWAMAKQYARYGAGLAAIYMLAGLAGGEVEWDKRASDFGKIRFGNTRMDPLSGFSQFIVFANRILRGETKTQRGEIVPLYGDDRPYGGRDIMDVGADFARSKLSPMLSVAADLATRENFIGESTDPTTLEGWYNLSKRFAGPIGWQDIYKVVTDDELDMPRKAVIPFFTFLGWSTSTYEPRGGGPPKPPKPPAPPKPPRP